MIFKDTGKDNLKERSGHQIRGRAICAGLSLFIVILLSWPIGVWAQERISITSSMANVRSGPGTNHDVLWQIEKYHPIIIVTKQGNWYQFKDFEDDFGWVHESLVGKVPSVISIKNSCNVRSGPGTNHKVVFTVEKGVPFKVLGKKDKWVHIEHSDGDQGWIFESLVW